MPVSDHILAICALCGTLAGLVGGLLRLARMAFQAEQTRKDVKYLAQELIELKEKMPIVLEMQGRLDRMERTLEHLVEQVQLLREALAAAGIERRSDFGDVTPAGGGRRRG